LDYFKAAGIDLRLFLCWFLECYYLSEGEKPGLRVAEAKVRKILRFLPHVDETYESGVPYARVIHCSGLIGVLGAT
jgi:hypothetical protein